jgi:hypothetical protein
MKRIVLVVALAALVSSCGGEPMTKGDIADRQAAMDAADCVKKYSGGSDVSDNWALCIDAISGQAGRNPEKVKDWVNRQQGRKIFQ